jgi:hypothetical protein
MEVNIAEISSTSREMIPWVSLFTPLVSNQIVTVHSGEFPLHYNVDSFCESEIVT